MSWLPSSLTSNTSSTSATPLPATQKLSNPTLPALYTAKLSFFPSFFLLSFLQPNHPGITIRLAQACAHMFLVLPGAVRGAAVSHHDGDAPGALNHPLLPLSTLRQRRQSPRLSLSHHLQQRGSTGEPHLSAMGAHSWCSVPDPDRQPACWLPLLPLPLLYLLHTIHDLLTPAPTTCPLSTVCLVCSPAPSP